MINQDPELQAQLELCLVRMPNQSLTEDDARHPWIYEKKWWYQINQYTMKTNKFLILITIVMSVVVFGLQAKECQHFYQGATQM